MNVDTNQAAPTLADAYRDGYYDAIEGAGTDLLAPLLDQLADVARGLRTLQEVTRDLKLGAGLLKDLHPTFVPQEYDHGQETPSA